MNLIHLAKMKKSKPNPRLRDLLRAVRSAEFVKGRLEVDEFRIDMLPTHRWYVCVNGSPVVAAGFQGVTTGKRAALRALKRVIRKRVAADAVAEVATLTT